MLDDPFLAKPAPWKQVRSSNIKAIRQNADNTVDVAFVSGGICRFRGIPKPLVDDWLIAESVGKYFNAHVRNRYSFEPIIENVDEKEPTEIPDEPR